MVTTNKKLQIKFAGASNEIMVDLFIESLTNYAIVAQESSSTVYPGSKLNIKIKALKPGSFIVVLDLILENIPGLFNESNIGYAADVVGVVGGLYGLKKWLSKNGNPDNVELINDNDIKISNNKGSIVISQNVYNVYSTNPKVRDSIRKTFNKLKEPDNDISSFEISELNDDEVKSVFEVNKNDFPLMSSDKDEIEKRKRNLKINQQELSVFKVVFGDNYKWEFYYNGNKIFADLRDVSFNSKIEKGEIAFRSGDKLIVDLEIEQVFNELANIFENRSYHILKVDQHTPRIQEQQSTFNFDSF